MTKSLLTSWAAEPGIWLGVALTGCFYAVGLRTLWRRAGVGHGVRVRQAISFGAGLLALGLALASPLDHLAEELLSAHMVQHLLLILVAAPLLVLGAPAAAFAWALPRRSRLSLAGAWHKAGALRAGWRQLARPATAWALHLVVLYIWHLPALYQAALADERLHALEHLLFLGTAFLFWQSLLQLGGQRKVGYGASILYLFAAALAETPLGALMLFSQQPWYAAYAGTAPGYGLSALQDQQLAGSIMWVPSGLIMLGVAAAMFLTWLDALEKRMQEGE